MAAMHYFFEQMLIVSSPVAHVHICDGERFYSTVYVRFEALPLASVILISELRYFAEHRLGDPGLDGNVSFEIGVVQRLDINLYALGVSGRRW